MFKKYSFCALERPNDLTFRFRVLTLRSFARPAAWTMQRAVGVAFVQIINSVVSQNEPIRRTVKTLLPSPSSYYDLQLKYFREEK